jgi:hypothetical protein
VIILANVSNLMPELLANKIADLFLGQFIKPEQPKISVDSTIFQNYIGKYFSDFLGIVSISCKNNDLMIQASLGFPELKLVAESETSFFRELPNIRITFQKDDYSEFILYDPGNEFRIKRIESSKPALKELKEYVGRYYSEEIDQIYTLTINNDSLYIANFEMVLAVIDKFITDWGIFRFKRENNGNIEGFKLNAGRVRNLWFKRS